MKTKASGTAESLRFAALAIKGVRDVRIREASYGIGSCDVIVVPEVSSAVKSLPEAILAAVNTVKPVGVRMNVRIAEKVVFNLSATITIPVGNSDNAIAGIRNQAALFVRRYINSLTIGDIVSLSAIEQEIKRSSDLIRGVTFNGFSANGSELPLQDYVQNSVKEYPAAGNINIYSVIIGNSNY
jgi:phage-related baseplate assembly protein